MYFTGLSPTDSFDEAFADMINDGAVDLRNAVVKFHFEKDEARKVFNWAIPTIKKKKSQLCIKLDFCLRIDKGLNVSKTLNRYSTR